jgi:hypothetical protein
MMSGVIASSYENVEHFYIIWLFLLSLSYQVIVLWLFASWSFIPCVQRLNFGQIDSNYSHEENKKKRKE